MLKYALHESWTLRAVGQVDHVPPAVQQRDIPASVPGCVHTDLLAAGLIADPYMDQNEVSVQWIGRTDWQYGATFEVDEQLLRHQRVDLICEGLDTVARVELNGQIVGEAADMHLPVQFDAKSALHVGYNTITITFTSALRYAEEMERKLGPLPHVGHGSNPPMPHNFIRKMACNMGWDWGPVLITAGIWQPIYLHAWDSVRIVGVRPLVQSASSERAVVDVLVDIEPATSDIQRKRYGVVATLTDPHGHVHTIHAELDADKQTTATLEIDQPYLWWPRGYGAQPLYDLSVVIIDQNEALPMPIDQWSTSIGLRTVRLNSELDEIGSKFILEINDQPIFCKGANWIPDDCFPHRVTEARYRRRLQQATGANMNMLRVWGGGLYETDAFYRICDELGILVWQDFLFACACYAEEEPFHSLVEAEARYHLMRLSTHPSLVLWNGCNENIWGYWAWGDAQPWREQVAGRTWGAGYYLELLPRLVKEVDPTRPYTPGSPYSGSMEVFPNVDTHGTMHIWDAWNTADYTIYRQYTPRFVSEFGHQGPPTHATLCRAIPVDQWTPSSPAMLQHQKAMDGQAKLNRWLAAHFNLPDTFDDWLYLAQVNHVRALETGIAWFRSRQPVCMGTLYWQLNDCWPVTSWAVVDGDGHPKPAWYATRRVYTDRMLTIQPEADGLALFAINDTGETWSADISLSRRTFEDQKLVQETINCNVPMRSSVKVCTIDPTLATPEDRACEVLIAQSKRTRATWFFDRDKYLRYPAAMFNAELVADNTTYYLTITARTLLRDIMVFADRLDPNATMNEQGITLLPGEAYCFVIESDQVLTCEHLTAAPVFQCANRFGKPPSIILI